MLPFKSYFPPCRCRNSALYPSSFLSAADISIANSAKTLQNASQPSGFNFSKADIPAYRNAFKDSNVAFDIHERPFQDFALRVTANMNDITLRQYALSDKLSDRRLIRARNYAIASRYDVPWTGQRTPDAFGLAAASKPSELVALWASVKLYDWYNSSYEVERTVAQAFIANPLAHEAVASGESGCLVMDEQQLQESCGVVTIGVPHSVAAGFMTSESTKNLRVALVNFGSRHLPLRHYDTTDVVPYVEDPATFTTACSTLELMSDLDPAVTMQSVLTSERRSSYWVGYHIPPGGVLSMDARMLETELCLGDRTLKYYVCGSADFREYVPFVRPDTEVSDFYDTMLWGWFGARKVKDQEHLEQRILLDIYGLLCTAITENVKILVVDLYGLQMYQHPLDLEAQLWKSVLDSVSRLFSQVVFVAPQVNKETNALHGAFAQYFKSVQM